MNSRQLHELQVLSLESGEKLGTLARTYLDGPQKRLAGFAFTESGGFLKVESEPNIDTTDVRTVGPDAVIVDRRESVQGDAVNAHYADFLVLDELIHRPVLSRNGTSVGRVASVEFDNRSFRLTEIEVQHGRFAVHQQIPIRQVVTIGPDYVIVNDGAIRLGDAPVIAAVEPTSEIIEGSAV